MDDPRKALAELRGPLTEAFNEWMRRYTEQPDDFLHTWEAVQEFLDDRRGGTPPSYGKVATEFLFQMCDKAREKGTETVSEPTPPPLG